MAPDGILRATRGGALDCVTATRASASTGKRNRNVDPLPTVLSTETSPPSSRAYLRAIDSPSPVPPYLRDVLPSP